MTRSVDLVIRNDLSEIAVVRDTLDRLGIELEVPARALMDLQVALDEIISNVVKYSWRDDGMHTMLVRIAVNATGISMDVFDDGQPFVPRQAPAAAARPAGQRPRPGGVGIQMAKRLVDDLNYERVGGRNHTTLTKRWTIPLGRTTE